MKNKKKIDLSLLTDGEKLILFDALGEFKTMIDCAIEDGDEEVHEELADYRSLCEKL